MDNETNVLETEKEVVENVETTNLEQESTTEKEVEKIYNQEDLDKLVEAALEKEREATKEKERIAKLSREEKLKEEKKILERERQEFEQLKLDNFKNISVSENGLDIKFSKFINGSTKEEILENIKEFKALYDKDLSNKVVQNTEDVTVKKSNNVNNANIDTKGMTYSERIALLNN